ncbi:hypothetical protein HPB52_011673 [Rhipicephalus sanguineus]|uniref:CCHC-type domain-containing protein n=2 Tax=Rhipicephalus sanguineus TaxID=34632 RepID=A0A9D4PGN7_RHISA|nr:hypothetical protein HPB52_011673 [Rhipicephalus sanguineus]
MGEDISAEELTEDAGWKTAGTRRSRTRHRAQDLPHDIDARTDMLGSGRQGTKPKNVKGKVIKAGRMPRLPKEDIKIVVRPQGGLDIVKVGAPAVTAAIFAAASMTGEESAEDTVCPNLHQNIVVVSTPKRANADRYARMRQIYIQGKLHEVNVYETAPDNTTKGVIRGIPIEDGPRALDENIVNPRNPLALAAKRIGNTSTVVIAFDGLKVPKLVRYGATLIPCTLYRKQIDICYQCGRLGHRMDVCPNPANRICRGCGLRNPNQEHQCSPKCDLCGGAHMTADKDCKARYKTPYVIRRRRWEHQSANNQLTQQDLPPTEMTKPRSKSRSRSRSRSCSRTRRSRAPTRSRSTTPAPVDKVSWADKVRGTAREGVGKAPTVPEQNQATNTGIVEELRKENAVMRDLLQKLMQEVRELRRERAAPEQSKPNEKHPVPASIPDAGAPAPKKRAMQPEAYAGGSESQVQVEIIDIKKMLRTMQSTIETLHATVLGLANRTTNLEGNMQMTMNHPVFTQHGNVTASSDAGPSSHQGQPGTLNPHHGQR